MSKQLFIDILLLSRVSVALHLCSSHANIFCTVASTEAGQLALTFLSTPTLMKCFSPTQAFTTARGHF
jgi:hypothetical protein